MIKNYKKSFEFVMKNKILIMLLLLYNLIVFPMKQFPIVTGIAYLFIALFFTAGILGIVQNIESIEVIKIKTLMKQGGKNFSYIILSTASILWISIVDFLLVLISGTIPMFIAGVVPSISYSKLIAAVMIVMVFTYRVALFITSFFPVIVNRKEYGKFAVIKQKEVLWKNKKFWLMIVVQVIVYLVMFGMIMIIKDKISGIIKLYLDFALNAALSFIAMIFYITDFYIYKEIIEKTADLKETLDENSYKGPFKTIIGKYLM